ncbi:MAG: hypothetical protein N4A38_05845 [Candidatus Gracilibacteria bacterium]|nr:hypothetical protein [Candidatus Gracilibacteria bacterium]
MKKVFKLALITALSSVMIVSVNAEEEAKDYNYTTTVGNITGTNGSTNIDAGASVKGDIHNDGGKVTVEMDSFVKGNLTSNGGTILVKSGSFVEENVVAEKGEEIVIDNQECIKNPEKCPKEPLPDYESEGEEYSTGKIESVDTISDDKAGNVEEVEVNEEPKEQLNAAGPQKVEATRLPTTGAEEVVLLILALVLAGGMMVYKTRKA